MKALFLRKLSPNICKLDWVKQFEEIRLLNEQINFTRFDNYDSIISLPSYCITYSIKY